jgi:hypothetical protein
MADPRGTEHRLYINATVYARDAKDARRQAERALAPFEDVTISADSATGRMEAARRHRTRAYAERNELIAVLARLYDGHLMPAGGRLESLDRRWVVCIHTPEKLCWVITQEERNQYFKLLDKIDDNHWDHSTRADRSARLEKLTALPPPRAATRPKKKARSTSRVKRRAINR